MMWFPVQVVLPKEKELKIIFCGFGRKAPMLVHWQKVFVTRISGMLIPIFLLVQRHRDGRTLAGSTPKKVP